MFNMPEKRWMKVFENCVNIIPGYEVKIDRLEAIRIEESEAYNAKSRAERFEKDLEERKAEEAAKEAAELQEGYQADDEESDEEEVFENHGCKCLVM
ncbi:MAG: hypothetical protein SFW66_00245 [Gammaproteobacteria bacterium]|nr:hypothetical protein [Gammaproteobacteria bacterium]